jgi:outer membrane protein OmpA-like peptidoglycan-associated protein
MITPDSGSATVFHSIKWLGAPPVNSATPTISSHPSSSTKTVGDSLSLSVTATASDGGTLSYQWSKGGANISGANSATYLIPSVVLSDAGSFTVVVTNTAGSNTPTSVTSNAAVVTVAAAPSAPSPSTPSSNAPAATTPAATTPSTTAGSTLNTKTAKAGAIAFSAGNSAVSSATKKNIKATVKEAGKSAKYTITGSAGQLPGVSDKAVKALAKKRANVLKAYLVKLGVPKSSITIKTKVVKQGKKPKASVLALY